jgi:hypothetical protein
MIHSFDPMASVASFDLAASGSSSGDELFDPCLIMISMIMFYACYSLYLCIRVMILTTMNTIFTSAIKLSLISAGTVS